MGNYTMNTPALKAVTIDTNAIEAKSIVLKNQDGTVTDIKQALEELNNGTGGSGGAGGHAIGEQWISFDGTIPDGGLPFDGQLRNVELYQQLFDWAKENGRVISETEWQNLRETNNGNVPYYSAGDGSMGKKASGSFTTYRLYGLVKFVVNSVDFAVSFSEDTIVSELERLNNLSDFPVIIEYVPIMGVLGFPDEGATEQWDFNIIAKEEGTIGNSYTFQYVADDDTSYDVSLSGGQDEVESTTFRLPIFNSYFKADVVGGGYIAEGLPNIVGNIYRAPADYAKWEYDGAFEITADESGCDRGGGGGQPKMKNINFDASRYSAIYGNSEHVTPETSTVIVGVWAVGSYTNVTNIDMSQIKEAINVASTLDALPLLSYHWDYKREGNAGWVKADGYWLSGTLYKDAYEKLLEMFENQPPSSTGIDYGMKFRLSTYTASIDKSNPYDFLIDTTAMTFRLPFLSRADRLIVYKRNSPVINGGSTPRTVTETLYSDGTIEIDGTYDASSSTSGTISWITSLKVPYNLILQDTRHDGTETDTEGWGNLAGPSAYTATSFRVSHYKGTGRIIDFHIKGEPTTIDVPKYRMMYFKLGNTFINEEQMDAVNLSNKIDRVWEAWQEGDYVVEQYSNGTEWYRLYKSGWVEQGGKYIWDGKTTTPRDLPITLYKEMIDTNYTVHVTMSNYTATGYNAWVNSITTTGFTLYASGTAGVRSDIFWRACGKTN